MNAKRAGGLAVLLGVLVATAGCARGNRGAPAASHETAPAPAAPSPGSLREVHVALEIELASAGGARAAFTKLGDVARGTGGYVQLASFGKDEGRSHLVLRVPPGSLAALRAVSAEAGAVVRDEETTTDVTDAIADVDARLHAGRTEEARLLALVGDRTGSVADVLAAERALADVRDRIERLDAESRASHGRVELATVDIWIAHPVAGAPEGSIATRLVAAAMDGLQAAGEVSLGAATVTLRAGPSVAIFGAFVAALVALVRRWRGRRRELV